MITVHDIIYYAIYIPCLFSSFKAKESSIPGLPFLRFMLCIGLGTEGLVEVLQFLKTDDTWPYYFYLPIEYCCLTLFYLRNTESPAFKKALQVSLPVYLTATILLSVFYYHFSGYPSLVYNINCFLNTVWIALLLFNFNLDTGKAIWRHPLFIILSALIFFFAGIFFFNTTYTYVLKKDPNLADTFRTYVNTVINCIFYTLLLYGFLCSAKTTK